MAPNQTRGQVSFVHSNNLNKEYYRLIKCAVKLTFHLIPLSPNNIKNYSRVNSSIRYLLKRATIQGVFSERVELTAVGKRH